MPRPLPHGEEQAITEAVSKQDWETLGHQIEQLDPQGVSALTEALMIDGNLAAAERVLERALASAEGVGGLWFQRGVGASLSLDWYAAESHFSRAVSAASPEPRALAYLSHICLAKEELGRALSYAEQARVALPDDPEGILSLAQVLLREGNRTRLRKLVSSVEATLPSPARARLEALLLQPGSETPIVFPSLAVKAYTLARELNDDCQPQRAIPLLYRAMELWPTMEDAVVELGSTLADVGRYEEAVTHYDRVLERFPRLSVVRLARANCFMRIDRLERAVEDFERCIEELSEWPSPYPNLIQALCRLGRWGAATKRLAAYRELDADPTVLRMLQKLVDRSLTS